jgi:hypothetical protein
MTTTIRQFFPGNAPQIGQQMHRPALGESLTIVSVEPTGQVRARRWNDTMWTNRVARKGETEREYVVTLAA